MLVVRASWRVGGGRGPNVERRAGSQSEPRRVHSGAEVRSCQPGKHPLLEFGDTYVLYIRRQFRQLGRLLFHNGTTFSPRSSPPSASRPSSSTGSRRPAAQPPWTAAALWRPQPLRAGWSGIIPASRSAPRAAGCSHRKAAAGCRSPKRLAPLPRARRQCYSRISFGGGGRGRAGRRGRGGRRSAARGRRSGRRRCRRSWSWRERLRRRSSPRS